jgi:hypothetical protein
MDLWRRTYAKPSGSSGKLIVLSQDGWFEWRSPLHPLITQLAKYGSRIGWHLNGESKGNILWIILSRNQSLLVHVVHTLIRSSENLRWLKTQHWHASFQSSTHISHPNILLNHTYFFLPMDDDSISTDTDGFHLFAQTIIWRNSSQLAETPPPVIPTSFHISIITKSSTSCPGAFVVEEHLTAPDGKECKMKCGQIVVRGRPLDAWFISAQMRQLCDTSFAFTMHIKSWGFVRPVPYYTSG